jgi:hypothetical protein
MPTIDRAPTTDVAQPPTSPRTGPSTADTYAPSFDAPGTNGGKPAAAATRDATPAGFETAPAGRDAAASGRDTTPTVPDARTSGADAQPPGFHKDNLGPTLFEVGGREMRQGDDGRAHAEGDPRDTFRNRIGSLVDARTMKIRPDVNPANPEGRIPIEVVGLPLVFTPEPGESPTADWVLETRDALHGARRDAAQAWSTFQPMLQELVDHPQLPFQLQVRSDGRVSSRGIGYDEVLTLAELVPDNRVDDFMTAGNTFVDAASDAKVASEALGVAGAEYFYERHFPDAIRLTPDLGPIVPVDGPRPRAPHERGTPNNFDNLLLNPKPKDTLVLAESKGGDNPKLGTRQVQWQGKVVDAQQLTTPYTADLLPKDTKLRKAFEELAEAGDEDDLARRVVTAVRDGQMESWLVHTDKSGTVNAQRTRLDTEYLKNVRISGIDESNGSTA